MTKQIVNQNIIAKAVLKLLFNKTELKSRNNKLKKPNYTGRNKRQLCTQKNFESFVPDAFMSTQSSAGSEKV